MQMTEKDWKQLFALIQKVVNHGVEDRMTAREREQLVRAKMEENDADTDVNEFCSLCGN